MQESITYLTNTLKDDDVVVVGLSGGPDSMCLLDILIKLNKKLKIIAAHINHNIRKESEKEAIFVEEYCKNKNIIYEYIKFPKKNEKNNFNEQELRKRRYEFYEKIIKKYNAKYLLTAHHGDDLIETILMRITRGSNLKGYTGFQVCTQKNGYCILKPLIFTTKDDIQNYNEINNIPFVIDKTNEEDIYTRNRYRHHVLPFLKKENQDIHKKYLKFSNELLEYYNYIERIVSKHIAKEYVNNTLNINNIKELDDFILKKIIEEILKQQYVDNLDLVSDKHIDEIMAIIKNNKPNISYNLPGRTILIKEYDKLVFTKSEDYQSSYKLEYKDGMILPNGHSITKINSCDKKSNFHIRLNSKEIKLPLYIRTRLDGDRIDIKNMNGSKKVKDIFIDCKIPTKERNSYPIVTDSENNILWIPGLKKSKFDKEKEENYDIILWYN